MKAKLILATAFLTSFMLMANAAQAKISFVPHLQKKYVNIKITGLKKNQPTTATLLMGKQQAKALGYKKRKTFQILNFRPSKGKHTLRWSLPKKVARHLQKSTKPLDIKVIVKQKKTQTSTLRLLGTKTPEETQSPLIGNLYGQWKLDDPMNSTTPWSGFYFQDKNWVYKGIPEQGDFPTCTATTATFDSEGMLGDGCLPWNQKNGKVAITGYGELSFDKNTLSIGEDKFEYLPFFAQGDRLSFALHSIVISGYWPYQSSTTKWLSLGSDGRFVFSQSSIGSFGIPGTPGSGNWSSVPPDSKGIYSISQRTITLQYEDGKTQTSILALTPDYEKNNFDYKSAGVLIGNHSYWPSND